jgi:hypothetical protein
MKKLKYASTISSDQSDPTKLYIRIDGRQGKIVLRLLMVRGLSSKKVRKKGAFLDVSIGVL